jgi:predicted neutral ceramidase superfamily lipid hydrolase
MSTSRMPISRINLILLVAIVAGLLVAIVLQNWTATIALSAIGVFGIGGAILARRPGSSDLSRINALEYRDERDRALAQSGLATVGASALVVSVVAFIAALLFADPVVITATAVLTLYLYLVWAIANWRTVSRG